MRSGERLKACLCLHVRQGGNSAPNSMSAALRSSTSTCPTYYRLNRSGEQLYSLQLCLSRSVGLCSGFSIAVRLTDIFPCIRLRAEQHADHLVHAEISWAHDQAAESELQLYCLVTICRCKQATYPSRSIQQLSETHESTHPSCLWSQHHFFLSGCQPVA